MPPQSRERNLVLRVTGSITDVRKKFKELDKEARGLGLSLSKQINAADAAGKRFVGTLTFAGGKIQDLKRLGATALQRGGDATLTQNFEQQERNRTKALRAAAKERERILAQVRAKRLRAAQRVNSNLVQLAKENAAVERSIALNGSKSRIAIKTRAAQQEKVIFRTLQADLKKIAARAGQGTLAGGALATATTSKIKRAQGELSALYARTGKQLATLPVNLSKVVDGHRGWIRRVTEVVGVYRLVNFAINTIIESIKSIPNVGIELQATSAVLESTLGSSAAAAAAFRFLDSEADRVGIRIKDIRQNFRNLNASMSLAGERTSTVLKVFTDLNTVVTALHLPSAKIQDVFLAIAQIFNKTKVQSEELVKQLGNLLPGAFASFAAATGKSTLELVKQMQLGLVAAHDNVVAFTDFLAKRFAAGFAIAEQGLKANVDRMVTSFTRLGEQIFSISQVALTSLTKNITSFVNSLGRGIEIIQEFSTLIGVSLVFGITKAVAAFLGASTAVVAITTGLKSYTVAAGLARVATLTLASSIAFLTAPTTIIAGIAAIAYGISQIDFQGRKASRSLQELLKTRDNLLGSLQTTPPTVDIEVRIDQAPAIQQITKSIEAAQKEADVLQKKIDNLSGGRRRNFRRRSFENDLAIVKDLIARGSRLREDARGAERLKIEVENKRQADSEKQLQDQLANIQEQGRLKRLAAEREYQQVLSNTRSAVLEASGKEREAALERLELTRQNTLAKLTGTDAETLALREQFVATKELQEAEIQSKFNILELAEEKKKLALFEAITREEAAAGHKTEAEAIQEIIAKQRESLINLQELLQKQRELAGENPAESLVESFDEAEQRIELFGLQIEAAALKAEGTWTQLAKSVGGAFKNSLGNAFAGFIRGTKTAGDVFTDFVSGVLSNIARLAANELATIFIKSAAAGLTSFFSPASGAAATGSAFSPGAIGAGSSGFAAKGRVTKGLSEHSGRIISKPTLFPSANIIPFQRGGILAGEAGEEAILPLKRNRAGKLGVEADVSGNVGGNVYNINVTVQSNERETSEETGLKIATTLIRKIAQQEIGTANRIGNQSNKITVFK